MIQFLIENIVSIAIAFIGGGAWLFERNKRKAGAIQEMQKAYDMLVKDYNRRFEEMQKRIDYLEDKLRKKNEEK